DDQRTASDNPTTRRQPCAGVRPTCRNRNDAFVRLAQRIIKRPHSAVQRITTWRAVRKASAKRVMRLSDSNGRIKRLIPKDLRKHPCESYSQTYSRSVKVPGCRCRGTDSAARERCRGRGADVKLLGHFPSPRLHQL